MTWTDYDRRAQLIPGRSLTRSKAPGRFFDEIAWPDGPRYASQSLGYQVIDDCGRTLIDMLCALGAISVGYQTGLRWEWSGVSSLPSVWEGRAAEAMLQVVPWADTVKFTKTGSEATHAAYRIAKRATGRATVLVLEGAYHGWHEWCDEAPRFAVGEVPPLDGIAAVFVEPPRWQQAPEGWVHALRAACTKAGTLLVFDSMIYGGRHAVGGASEYYRVIPDLECFGKAIGNGASIAAVVGGDVLRAHGDMVSGTYSGEIHGLRALVWTLQQYRERAVLARLQAAGLRLWAGLTQAGIPLKGVPVHCAIAFTAPEQGLAFGAAMIRRGVLWHPAVTNVMAAHAVPGVIEQVIQAAIDSWHEVTPRG